MQTKVPPQDTQCGVLFCSLVGGVYMECRSAAALHWRLRDLFGGAVLASQSALGGREGCVCVCVWGGGGYVFSLPAIAAVKLVCCQSAMDRWFYVLSPSLSVVSLPWTGGFMFSVHPCPLSVCHGQVVLCSQSILVPCQSAMDRWFYVLSPSLSLVSLPWTGGFMFSVHPCLLSVCHGQVVLCSQSILVCCQSAMDRWFYVLSPSLSVVSLPWTGGFMFSVHPCLLSVCHGQVVLCSQSIPWDQEGCCRCYATSPAASIATSLTVSHCDTCCVSHCDNYWTSLTVNCCVSHCDNYWTSLTVNCSVSHCDNYWTSLTVNCSVSHCDNYWTSLTVNCCVSHCDNYWTSLTVNCSVSHCDNYWTSLTVNCSVSHCDNYWTSLTINCCVSHCDN